MPGAAFAPSRPRRHGLARLTLLTLTCTLVTASPAGAPRPARRLLDDDHHPHQAQRVEDAHRSHQTPPPTPQQQKHTWPPTSSSSTFFPYDCTPRRTNTSLLLAALADPPPPTAHSFPPWITAACPAVAAHFTTFPLFHAFHPILPVSTTAYAAAGACTLQLTLALADAAGGPQPMLHAGAHLGALIHGGPIPWDDDVDALLPWGVRDGFLAACAAARHAVHPSVSLMCRVTDGAIKLFVRERKSGSGSDGQNTTTTTSISSPTRLGWSAPFVDLFLFKLVDGRGGGRLVEVSARTGAPTENSWPVRLALPTRPYFFAGVVVPGPPPALASARYDTAACVSASWNHRQEDWVPEPVRSLRLDCCALAAAGFPFIVRVSSGGGDEGRATTTTTGSLALVGGSGRALVVDHLGGRPRAEDDGAAAALKSTVVIDEEAVPLVLGVPPPPPTRPPSARVAVALAATASLASFAALLAHVFYPPRRRDHRGAGLPSRAAARDAERE